MGSRARGRGLCHPGRSGQCHGQLPLSPSPGSRTLWAQTEAVLTVGWCHHGGTGPGDPPFHSTWEAGPFFIAERGIASSLKVAPCRHSPKKWSQVVPVVRALQPWRTQPDVEETYHIYMTETYKCRGIIGENMRGVEICVCLIKDRFTAYHLVISQI